MSGTISAKERSPFLHYVRNRIVAYEQETSTRQIELRREYNAAVNGGDITDNIELMGGGFRDWLKKGSLDVGKPLLWAMDKGSAAVQSTKNVTHRGLQRARKFGTDTYQNTKRFTRQMRNRAFNAADAIKRKASSTAKTGSYYARKAYYYSPTCYAARKTGCCGNPPKLKKHRQRR